MSMGQSRARSGGDHEWDGRRYGEIAHGDDEEDEEGGEETDGDSADGEVR